MADLTKTLDTGRAHSSTILRSTVSPSEAPKAIALIDARIPCVELLLKGIKSNVHPIVLDASDTFRTITKTLSQYGDLEALHLIAHGSPGQLHLGSSWVTAQTLQNGAEEVRQWGQSLAKGADLLIYGCHSGASVQGQAFLETWRSLLSEKSVNVAAASHAVGSPKVGASWSLDRVLGQVRSALAWDLAAIAAYPAHFGFPNQFYGVTQLDGDGRQNDLVTVDLATGQVFTIFQNLPIPNEGDPLDSSAIARLPNSNSVFYLNNRLGGGRPRGRAANSFDEFQGQIGIHTIASSGSAVLTSGEAILCPGTSNQRRAFTYDVEFPEIANAARTPLGRGAFDQFSNLVVGRGNEVQFINVSGTGDQTGLAARGTIDIDNVVNSSNPFPGVTSVISTTNNDVARGFHSEGGSGDFAFDPSDGSLYVALRTSGVGRGTLTVDPSDNTSGDVDNVLDNNDQLDATSQFFSFRTPPVRVRDALRGRNGAPPNNFDNLVGDGREVSELYRIGRAVGTDGIDFSTPIVSQQLLQDGNVENIPLRAQLISTYSGVGFSGLAFGYDGELYASSGVNNGTVQTNQLLQLDRTTGQILREIDTRIDVNDSNTSVNIGDLATLPLPSPIVDVDLTKSDGLTQVTPGSQVSYTIT
ncbi:MAG: DUF4347 domain-containing protein, partial [Cyanobacteria bacterium P01_D01_bin.73]